MFRSFRAFLQEQEPLLTSDVEDGDAESLEVIRRFPNQQFWKDLQQLANSNRHGLAKLLQVRPDAIARWPQTINRYLDMMTRMNAQEQRPQMIPTGKHVRMLGNFGDSNAANNGVV